MTVFRKPGRELSPETESCWTPALNFPASRIVRNKATQGEMLHYDSLSWVRHLGMWGSESGERSWAQIERTWLLLKRYTWYSTQRRLLIHFLLSTWAVFFPCISSVLNVNHFWLMSHSSKMIHLTENNLYPQVEIDILLSARKSRKKWVKDYWKHQKCHFLQQK